jgi:hypothetical protein
MNSARSSLEHCFGLLIVGLACENSLSQQKPNAYGASSFLACAIIPRNAKGAGLFYEQSLKLRRNASARAGLITILNSARKQIQTLRCIEHEEQ